MESLIRESRTTFRSLVKNPTLTSVALVTLALGIGANAAIYSVVRGALLAPLPYPDADRLVRVWPEMVASTELYEYLRERTPALTSLSIYEPTAFAVSGDGRPEEVAGARVGPRYFDVLDVPPVLGRAFTAEESEAGRGDVVVLSHGLWQSRFGGDPGVLGRSLDLDGRRHVVVGVMPPEHAPLHEAWRLWVPLEVDRSSEEHWDWLSHPLVGRLADGATTDLAAAEVRAAVTSYGEEVRPGYFADMLERGITVVPLKEHLVGDVKATFLLLSGAVGLVLLVACSNVANLLLARITSRRRELALRGALGAGRGRLVAHVLGESLVLSLAGGGLGLLAAAWTLAALVDQLPASVPRTGEIAIDAGVVVFTIVLSVFSALLFGALPAWKAVGVDLVTALAGGRGVEVSRQRLNQLLVAAETALATLLVLGAGLLVKSFGELQDVELGFSSARVLTLDLEPNAVAHPDNDARRRYFEAVVERVRAVPWVASAAVMNRAPMTPGDVRVRFALPGDDGTQRRTTSVRTASPAFLETLGMRLVAGRPLADTDRPESPPVGLVNETLARELWGDGEALGRRLVYDDGEPWFTVVGVVADVRPTRLERAAGPQVFRPLAQASWEPRMSLVVRAAASTAAVLPALEEAIWSVDPDVPVARVATMDELVRRSLRDSRLLTALFSLFGLLALVLGGVGVFGVTSYTVSQRVRENGIRLALGATTGDVLRTALGRALWPVAAGLVAGGLASGLLGGLLEAFLFEVAPHDPPVFAAAVGLLAASALAAAWLPARRATRVDPMTVLKAD